MNEASLNQPLAGVRVIVTRPAKQAAIFAQRLALIGGEPIICPAMIIAPPSDPAPFRAALAQLAAYDYALFVSANAAEAVLSANVDWPRALTAIAVGPTTADALILGGVPEVLVPPARYDSEGVLLLDALQRVDGKRFVLFRGEGADGTTGRELMRATLLARGAQVDAVTCYRRAKPTFDVAELLEQWRDGRVDAIVATSAEVLDNFVALIGEAGRPLLDATPLFVPHQRIADHARGQGLHNVVTTDPTDAGLLAGLLEHFRDAAATPASARSL
jgi:uroporphyrinogen-III synthase